MIITALSQKERTSSEGLPKFQAGFRPPWELGFVQNQVWNRLFMDTIGYHGPTTLMARNKFERIEIAWDWACVFMFNVGMPILMGKIFNDLYCKKYLASIKIKHKLPLNIPFEALDSAVLNTKKGMQTLQNTLKTPSIKVTRQVAALVLKGKMGILLFDLFFLALKGQAGHWGKLFITEKLSGKKGFSGEFNYTSEAYRKLKSETHEKTKAKKWLVSLGFSIAGFMTLPIIMQHYLKNPSMLKNATLSGKFIQKSIGLLNYHNAIYMSKYLLLWHSIFNGVAPMLLSARDSHEFRERLTKLTALEFFFFIGDDVITGLTAKYLQHKYKAKLKGLPIVEKGLWGFPKGVSMVKLANNPTKHAGYPLALQLTRVSFWTGLISSGLFLGIILNLLNNIYTKRKALKEQAQLQLAGQ